VLLAVLAAVIVAVVVIRSTSDDAAVNPADPAGLPTSQVPAGADAFTDPVAVAAAYWQAWCPWNYRDPATARTVATRNYLTVRASADLAVDSAWWKQTVIAEKSVATCTPAVVVPAEGPDDASSRYLTITGTRTITADDKTATENLTEQRLVSLQPDGRWLVDRRVEGN